MAGRIFHLDDKGDATPMEEQPYDAEKTLQELLAKHPDFLDRTWDFSTGHSDHPVRIRSPR